ncbi:phospholipase C type enzyme [Taxawa tesnikishii (nom. ined.)]|nr:phospholipase C type enzyme [Dothideales sp. JES 119]
MTSAPVKSAQATERALEEALPLDGMQTPQRHTSPLELPTSLRIISLNCWGLKYISKHRHERLSEIGTQIANADPQPSIVGLQECWTQQDYLAIRERTKHILPYGKYYFSGIFGGGLAILSKWPIEESSMVRYPLNGRPAAFYRGDWFVGKGVACARIRIGPGKKDVVEVFCTHLHAPYEGEPNDSYICHRTAQAWEIARLMRHAAERGHLVLGLGDFNMIPLSLAHRLIETHSPVKDVWRIIHPDSAIGSAESKAERARGRPVPSADECLAEHGTTCDSRYNTWRWNKGQQKQLDKGEEVHVDGKNRTPRPSDWTTYSLAEIQLPGARIGHDHFSVETTLRRMPSSAPQQDVASSPSSKADSTRTLATAQSQPPAFLPLETYDEIMAMIQKYVLRERKQRRLRLYHFGTEICISIGCLVATWWSPRNFVAFLLMLLSTLGLSAGVIDGLMGGLFVGSELRALKEFEWEIETTREMAAAAALKRE